MNERIWNTYICVCVCVCMYIPRNSLHEDTRTFRLIPAKSEQLEIEMFAIRQCFNCETNDLLGCAINEALFRSNNAISFANGRANDTFLAWLHATVTDNYDRASASCISIFSLSMMTSVASAWGSHAISARKRLFDSNHGDVVIDDQTMKSIFEISHRVLPVSLRSLELTIAC